MSQRNLRGMLRAVLRVAGAPGTPFEIAEESADQTTALWIERLRMPAMAALIPLDKARKNLSKTRPARSPIRRTRQLHSRMPIHRGSHGPARVRPAPRALRALADCSRSTARRPARKRPWRDGRSNCARPRPVRIGRVHAFRRILVSRRRSLKPTGVCPVLGTEWRLSGRD